LFKFVLTQSSQLEAGGVTPVGGGATPSPDQLGPQVVRALDPWTYDQDHTWAGARAVRGKRGRHI
jgi:hypothetical protein